MISWIIENSLLTSCVMLVVFALCRLNRKRPALCHLLWILAFASLIMPPVPIDTAPGSQLRAQLSSWLQTAPGVTPPLALPSMPTFSGELDAAEAGVDRNPGPVLELVEPTIAASPSWFAQITLGQWLVGLWAIGAFLLSGLACYRILRFNKLVHNAPAAGDALRSVVDEVASRLGVRVPDIRLMEGTGSPAIWCFGSPLLLWPTQSGAVVRHEGERSLIAHELAHVARRDHWVSRLDVIAIGLCWWNPLFWIIRHEVRHYAELSCDAWALWAYPTCRRDFAEALIESQERTQSATMAIEGLCATNSEFKNFERRLTMIMRTNVSRQVSKGAAAAALLTTLLVLPGFSGDGECTQQAVCDGSVVRNCIDEELQLKELVWKAEEQFKSQQYANAIQLYGEVLEHDPKHGKAHGRLGYMLIGDGQIDRAEKHFKMQFKSGHEVSTAVYNLACAASLKGDLERAGKYLTQSVRRGFTNAELMSKDTDLTALRGSKSFAWAIQSSKTSDALRGKLKTDAVAKDLNAKSAIYEVLAEIGSEDGELQNDAGLTFLLAGKHKRGLQAFERQVAAGYDVARAHYNIACAYALMGQPSAALTALETSVEMGMANAAVLEDEDLASLRSMPRFEAAAERLTAPAHFKARLKSAETPEQVAEVTRTLIELKSDESKNSQVRGWAAFHLGQLQMRTGELQASVASFQEAASIGYDMDSAAFQIGRVHATLGDQAEAIAFYTKAVHLGYADVKSMKWALESCEMADSEIGAKLIAKTVKSHEQLLKDKQPKKLYGSSDRALWDRALWDGALSDKELSAAEKKEKKERMRPAPAKDSSVSGLRF